MRTNKFKSLLNNTALMALALSVLLFVIMISFRPAALSLNTLATILSFSSMLLFVCAGQMIVITAGDGIDLAAGAIMSTTACITVEIMRGDHAKLVPVLVICMLAGLAFGTVSGLGVAYLKIPALIMTMCMSNVLGKLQLVISNGAPRGTVSPQLSSALTVRYLGFIPGILIYAVIFYAIVVLFMKRTRFGHRLHLVGTNFDAAQLSGIRAKRIRMLAYSIAGMLTGVGGLIGAGYYKQMQVATFDNYTMQSISAVVIGGTLLAGGSANYVGTVTGTLLLIVLSQFLSAINTSVAMRDIIMGGMLILLLIAYNRKPAVRQ